MGPTRREIDHKKTIQKKKNRNKKNSKLRGFFWQVLLPEGRYRRQAPCSDVLETLGLRGAQKRSKKAKNGQN